MRPFFWNRPSAEHPLTPMTLDPTMRAIRSVAMDAQRSRLPQMAAALSYRTIFGLLPVLAIALWILHRVVSPADIEQLIGRAIDALGLSSIVVNQGVASSALEDAPGGWFVGPPTPTVVAAPEGTALATDSLKKWITEFVARINSISFTAIGLVGLGTLIYAALSMVVEVERAFNQIYRVPHGRAWTRRLPIYWTLLTLGPLGLFATFYLQQRFGTWVQNWTGGEAAVSSSAITLTIIGYATQFLITSAMLLAIYLVVPNTRVRLLPALCGALLAAAIFEISKFGFAKYIEYSGSDRFARLYGSIALIPLFLLWVYFSWIIVLFGVQLAYQIQHGRKRTLAQPIADCGPALVEPTATLTVMAALGRAFSGGGTLGATDIARITRLSEPVVRLVLEKLSERILLHRLESAGEPGTDDANAEPTYALARPPSAIRVAELLSAGFELAATGELDPMVDRLHQAQIDAAGDETLADVLSATGEPPPASDGSAQPWASPVHRPPSPGGVISPALLRGTAKREDGDTRREPPATPPADRPSPERASDSSGRDRL